MLGIDSIALSKAYNWLILKFLKNTFSMPCSWWPQVELSENLDIIILSRLELLSCKQRKALLGVSSNITRTLTCLWYAGSIIMPGKLTSSDFQVCICSCKLRSF